jgi:hypothetical protein
MWRHVIVRWRIAIKERCCVIYLWNTGRLVFVEQVHIHRYS